MLTSWARLARWRDWVQSKLPFTAAVTMLLAPHSTSALELLAIVATVVMGAAFGYGLNEVADRASDERAGKANRAAGLGWATWLPFLGATGAAAIGLSLTWAPDAAAPVLVALGLLLAVAYSAPRLRLKERGGVGLVGAAAAQWVLPVLVVAAAEPGGWADLDAWAFALLSLAIGARWMAVHALRDADADRRSGIRTYAAARADVSRLLLGAFAAEVAFLVAALALTWPDSAAAAIALVPVAAHEAWLRRLRPRLAGYDEAPLATYYFLALPFAVAIGLLASEPGPALVLLALALPQVLARARYAASARARASAHSPVVSASDPHP